MHPDIQAETDAVLDDMPSPILSLLPPVQRPFEFSSFIRRSGGDTTSLLSAIRETDAHLPPGPPKQEQNVSSGDFGGIRINIWNRAKVQRFLTHSLAGGGSHNRGYHALRWEMILHGNAGEMGKYAVCSMLR